MKNTTQLIADIISSSVIPGSGQMAIKIMVTKMLTRVSSNNPFHARARIWSTLRRGHENRIHMMNRRTKTVFPANQI